MRTEPITPGQEKAIIRGLTTRRRRRDENRARLRKAEAHCYDLRMAVEKDEFALKALASLLVASEWEVVQGAGTRIHRPESRDSNENTRVIAIGDGAIGLEHFTDKSYTYDVPDVPAREI